MDLEDSGVDCIHGCAWSRMCVSPVMSCDQARSQGQAEWVMNIQWQDQRWLSEIQALTGGLKVGEEEEVQGDGCIWRHANRPWHGSAFLPMGTLKEGCVFDLVQDAERKAETYFLILFYYIVATWNKSNPWIGRGDTKINKWWMDECL